MKWTKGPRFLLTLSGTSLNIKFIRSFLTLGSERMQCKERFSQLCTAQHLVVFRASITFGFCIDLGSVLRTSLITSEIKWQIQDYIIALIRIWLIRFFERTCCWWLVWLDWVIWWFKRGYASILETTISNGSDWLVAREQRNDIISLKKSPDEKLDDKISGLL